MKTGVPLTDADWAVLETGASAAVTLIHSFRHGMADPLARAAPVIEMFDRASSGGTELDSIEDYEDLADNDELSLDSSIASE